MKKIVFILFVLFTVISNAQVRVQSAALDSKNETGFSASQPTDVRLLYPDLDKKAYEYVQNHPEYNALPRFNKAAFNFVVGSTYSWFAMNLSTSTFYSVPSTCRKVGTNCYVFVEDASWGARVTQAAVDSVQNAFDNKCPANASKGIYQMDVETFGNPPNVDGDSKIVILILDIKDSYANAGDSYTAGYFHSWNELPKANNYGSNEAEIYYLDCNPINLTITSGIQDAMSTTAHEFQHMIMYNYHYNASQITFMNEASSLIAEKVCGYPFREQSSFANDSPQRLMNWRSGNDAIKDYSRAARFMLYFYEQFGIQFLSKFVQSSSVGISGIDDALSKLSVTTSRRFADILPDWYIANAVDNKAFNSKWGYTLAGMPKPQGNTFWNANMASATYTSPFLGASIISLQGSSSVNSLFSNGNSTYLKIKAIKLGSGNPIVEDVNINSTYSIPALSGTYTSVQYLVLNSSSTVDYTYNYSSNGTNPSTPYEFKFDADASSYILYLDANYRQAVVFNAAVGCKLNSVKAALRNNNNPLTMEIYTYTGNKTSPLGTKLLNAVSVSNPNTTGAWITTSLSAYNITLDQPIVVVYKMTTTSNSGFTGNTVLVDLKSGVAYSNSLISADGVSFVWASDGSTNTYLNKIRAYGEALVGTEKEFELTPKEYALSQNYPNPFNPSTKIQFSLPEQTKVAIRIYDMLGREIKTLINSEQSAGRHEVNWNGDDDLGHKVATGVYMYAISTNKFVQTKKMILLK